MKKEVHSSRLKWKIQKSIILVLVCCMFCSTAAGSAYYLKQDSRQKIADEKSKLQHLANELDFMTEEIQSFGRSVAADERLRELLQETEADDAFARIRHTNEIIERLSFHNGFRAYIAGSFVEMDTGERYTSSISAIDQGYLERKFSMAALKEFQGHEDWKYSKPYEGIETRGTSSLICTRTEIWSNQEYGRIEGMLYLEVYLDSLLRVVREYGREYENLCLTGADGSILYSSRSDSALETYLRTKAQEPEADSREFLGRGSLIVLPVEQNGWELYTFISSRELWRRIWYTPVFLIIAFLVSLAVILVISNRILEQAIRPITRLSKEMEGISYDRLPSGERIRTGDEIEILYDCYRKMLFEIQRGIESKLESERRLQDMEFDIMVSQINPHYLYNVLNTVIYLSVASRNEDVVKIVRALIRTLQTTLELGSERMEISVEKELELTASYLDIQRYRYPQSFVYEVDCKEAERTCMVPVACIQPLVENALTHGILPTEETGRITVRISRQDNVLKICVQDDGGGMEPSVLAAFREGGTLPARESGRRHIGIANIRDRIAFLYGESYGMEIRTGENGTSVELTLPVRSC